jgi:hypothetical protein
MSKAHIRTGPGFYNTHFGSREPAKPESTLRAGLTEMNDMPPDITYDCDLCCGLLAIGIACG